MAIDPTLAGRLDDELTTDLEPGLGRLGKVRRYLKGEHDAPYTPKGAKKEYEHIAGRAITNLMPLVSDTFAKGLFVDGYRAAKSPVNDTAWSYWQANGLDARQSIATRGALEYGASYALVLPGTVGEKRIPFFRPLSPLRSAAWYRDDDDEFPEVALRRKGTASDGTRLVECFDAEARYTFALPKDAGKWILSATESHGLGVTPFVRFRDRLDGEAVGIIRPMFTIQDRINEIVFSTLIALQYASFRQRWATGLAIPEDDDGNAVEPFAAAVDRLWVSEDPTARFGDFAQTELSGHLSAFDSSVHTFAAISQISPNIFSGDLVNVAAEALASMQDVTQRKLGEYETLMGESWESGFRLAARAAGDPVAAGDMAAQVRWRDSAAQSLAATVDALGKLATMLSVPVEGLWEKIPGVTDQDVTYWKSLRTADPLVAFADELARQTDGPVASEAESTSTDIKAQADAMGVLIRSGVSAESAAAKVGLSGVEFTGAMPASLRLPEAVAAELETA